MSLSNKQKDFIKKHYRKISAEKIAREINVKEEDVKSYLKEIETKKQPPPKIFYLILLLIPVLFFVLLEAGLRVFNYGYNYEQWVQVDKERIGLNPDVARRYFYSSELVPESIKDVFLKEKPQNAFRVFVLGGSSAAGYPFIPNGSFSRYIRDRLNLLLPEKHVEVVNLSLTAVNSYTIRDFCKEIPQYEPDVVLIYAGHNEYYGALGVGSQESLGQSRFFVNLILSLNNFKTTQLIRDIITSLMSVGSDETSSQGTLMSRMAENQSIELNSEVYQEGISQFRENISDVIESANSSNIPVIISTLSSNLSDQPPFISKATNMYPPANEIFQEAKEAYQETTNEKCDSLFRYAKDLDLLRFRAPEKMNKTIKNIADEYDVFIVDVDSLFSSLSPHQVVGNNLMTDHLHPTLKGYFEIGKLFINKMYTANLLPLNKSNAIDYSSTDSLVKSNFHFTKLDSTIADFRIRYLMNDWPYVDPQTSLPPYQLLARKTKIDSLAYKVVIENYSWEQAQRDLANSFLAANNFEAYKNQMDNLISQFPYFEYYYDSISKELLKRKNYKTAYGYLQNRYEVKPSAFSSKWLGIISLSLNKINDAERYLLESNSLSNNDAQVLYNLAGVYINKKEYAKAKKYVEMCLLIDPKFNGAQQLQKQLNRIK